MPYCEAPHSELDLPVAELSPLSETPHHQHSHASLTQEKPGHPMSIHAEATPTLLSPGSADDYVSTRAAAAAASPPQVAAAAAAKASGTEEAAAVGAAAGAGASTVFLLNTSSPLTSQSSLADAVSLHAGSASQLPRTSPTSLPAQRTGVCVDVPVSCSGRYSLSQPRSFRNPSVEAEQMVVYNAAGRRRPGSATASDSQAYAVSESNMAHLIIYGPDLKRANSFVRCLLAGVFHTAVMVDNREYTYGCTGIELLSPRSQPHATYITSLPIGYITLAKHGAAEAIQQLCSEYQGINYHVLEHNCHNFASDMCKLLTGKPAPRCLNRLARKLAKVPFLSQLIQHYS